VKKTGALLRFFLFGAYELSSKGLIEVQIINFVAPMLRHIDVTQNRRFTIDRLSIIER